MPVETGAGNEVGLFYTTLPSQHGTTEIHDYGNWLSLIGFQQSCIHKMASPDFYQVPSDASNTVETNGKRIGVAGRQKDGKV